MTKEEFLLEQKRYLDRQDEISKELEELSSSIKEEMTEDQRIKAIALVMKSQKELKVFGKINDRMKTQVEKVIKMSKQSI